MPLTVTALLFVVALSASDRAFAAARACADLFREGTKPKVLASTVLARDQVSELISDPLKFEGKTVGFAPSENKFPEPFKIQAVRKLPQWLQNAVRDIHILARSPELREDIFGSSTSNRSFTTKPRTEPLNLAARDTKDNYPVVEVGLDVFTLSTGERVFFYHTSNDRAHIVSDYEFYLGLMDSLNLQGRKIVALNSLHTHPLNLLITLDDRDFFKTQLQLIRKEHPTLSFENWSMSTTIETEPVVHTVRLTDWLKEPRDGLK